MAKDAVVSERTAILAGAKKRQRSGKSRAKSGCRTCKARRVKCDEQRPVCQRCLSTGRVCEGYGIWGGGGNAYGSLLRRANRNVSCGPKVLTPSSLVGSASSEEEACFDFFRRRTAVKLPGVFESNFWDVLVLQISSTEPAVLHAVIALASLQRGQMLQDCARSAGDDASYFGVQEAVRKWNCFALQQYNKAITHLHIHFTAKNQRSLRIALTSCMIFTCIELLRREYRAANTHLESGLDLLCDMQQRQTLDGVGQRKENNDTLVLRPDPQSLDDNLIEAFTRLNILSVLFGFPSRYLYIVARDNPREQQLQIPDRFATVYEARKYLDGILNAVFRLVEICSLLDIGNDKRNHTHNSAVGQSSLLDRQRQLQSSLCDWVAAYDASIPNFLRSLNPRTGMGVPLLRIYHTMTSVMLSTCLNQDQPAHEMIYDNHTHAFASIINQAQKLVTYQDLPIPIPSNINPSCESGSINFTVDMGFIPPLYYTALKCRVPWIRRKAVDLLLVAPHREGMWDGALVAAVARKVIALEEEAFYVREGMDVSSPKSQSDSNHEKVSTFSQMLPESNRFHDVKVVLSYEEPTKGKLICRRKKLGTDSEDDWHIKEEPFEYEPLGVH